MYDVFGTVGSHNHFTAVPPHKLNYSNLNDANYNYVDVLNIDITGSTATFDIYADYDYPKTAATLSGPSDADDVTVMLHLSGGAL